jgi:hypothetical protein
LLSKFVEKLAATKSTMSEESISSEDLRSIVQDNAWIDLLDEHAIEVLSSNKGWRLEDVLDCILTGEYSLLYTTFDGGNGRLVYDPWSFPFGGTDAMKALIRTFGLNVTRDSLHDGFDEWKNSRL